jgi:hypothetical protein
MMWHELQKPDWLVTTIEPAAKKDTITAKINIFTGHFTCLKIFHAEAIIDLFFFTLQRHKLTTKQLYIHHFL